METIKKNITESVENYKEELFSIACDIFDHPEKGLEEIYASNLLTDFLNKKGFHIEKGTGGFETAFKAVWENGKGGPSIGFLVEYDALANLGHACGHHLQAPACIGAALSLMENCKDPFKIVIYGTPDEEGRGGKIVMEQAGCFRDVDVMFAYHAAQSTYMEYSNRALAPNIVTYHGTPSHASGSPEKGRSALDAMLLTFQGIEFMREHIKDGCRMQYTVLEGTGPANIVHETARARITMRSYDRNYLNDMQSRMKKIVEGACLMTETTADIETLNVYWNLVSVKSLREMVLSVSDELGAEKLDSSPIMSGGSTDIGNVSWVVPTAYLHCYFCDHPAHSEGWISEGKTENAKKSMTTGAKILALSALKIIKEPELIKKIKEEHKTAIANK